jgi:hypothetical protein
MQWQMRDSQGRRSRKFDSLAGDHVDDDLSSGVPLAEIPERRRNIPQLVPPVYDRSDRSGLEKLLQDHQILFVDLRQKRSHDTTAAGHRAEAYLQCLTQPELVVLAVMSVIRRVEPDAAHPPSGEPGAEKAGECSGRRHSAASAVRFG